MSDPHSEASISTDEGPPWDGHLRIEITQVSQDRGSFSSRVLVEGFMINDNDWEVVHPGGSNIERHISGEQDHYPDDFDFHLNPHSTYRFISHTFTVPHDDDGKKTVNFTVHYGQTDTPTFQHDKSVSTTLKLTPMIVGVWIRAGSAWVHSEPHVRYQGKWKPAVAYVRTGGVWKPCR